MLRGGTIRSAGKSDGRSNPVLTRIVIPGFTLDKQVVAVLQHLSSGLA
jgi:hypothetical protein